MPRPSKLYPYTHTIPFNDRPIKFRYRLTGRTGRKSSSGQSGASNGSNQAACVVDIGPGSKIAEVAKGLRGTENDELLHMIRYHLSQKYPKRAAIFARYPYTHNIHYKGGSFEVAYALVEPKRPVISRGRFGPKAIRRIHSPDPADYPACIVYSGPGSQIAELLEKPSRARRYSADIHNAVSRSIRKKHPRRMVVFSKDTGKTPEWLPEEPRTSKEQASRHIIDFSQLPKPKANRRKT